MRSLFSHCLFCCMQICWWRVQLQELLRVRGGYVGVGDDDGGGGGDDGGVVVVMRMIMMMVVVMMMVMLLKFATVF
jgi:hypothetical protein